MHTSTVKHQAASSSLEIALSRGSFLASGNIKAPLKDTQSRAMQKSPAASCPSPPRQVQQPQSQKDIYAPLNTALKRKIDPQNEVVPPTKSDPLSLMPSATALTPPSKLASTYQSKVAGKQLTLENPQKTSESRKKEIEKRKRVKAEKERAKLKGKKRRLVRELNTRIKELRYDHVLPLHKLWLGYMSEILNIPLDMTLASSSSSSTSTDPTPSAPRFIPTAADPNAPTLHHKITKTTASESFDMVTLPGLKSSKEAELHALKLPSSSSMMAKLVKADYHGCLITVKRARNPDLVGITGIVVQETENVFRVCTAKNLVKVIPKAHSVFSFKLPLQTPKPASPPARANPNGMDVDVPAQEVEKSIWMEFELYGNQICYRSAERAVRKFKTRASGIEL